MLKRAVGVKRLVMFRHGVAYVERRGEAEGSFELAFEQHEMNDVLKSLSVWVEQGKATVGAVAFDAPEDPRRLLESRNLLFDPQQVATGWLGALAGRRLTLQRGPDERITGEILGLEVTPGGDRPPRRQAVLRDGEDAIVLVDLATVSRVELEEAPSRADLAYLVDRSRAASGGTEKRVSIDLQGKAEELVVSYVIPAPVWRVSYRLVLDGGEARLMAWAIVHNPLQDDLKDVELTLTTGQPVSFVIDLYNEKRVERTVVEETARVAAAPTQYERAPRKRAAALPLAAGAPPPPPGMAPMPAPAAPKPMMAMAAMAFEGAAQAEERGEHFEFRVATPVSLKRGGSAMVPLASAGLMSKRERIWREGTGVSPDIVVSFTNTSEMVLEEGPVVVYDDGAYAGEAMVPYSARGTEVRLAFAKDLSVRCRKDVRHESRVTALRLGRDALIQEHLETTITELRGDNEHLEEMRVLFELRRDPHLTLNTSGTRPVEETASYRRFALHIPGSGHAECEIREHLRRLHQVQYSQLQPAQLNRWLEDHLLDEAAAGVLRDVLAAWQEAADLEARRSQLETQRLAHFEKQSRISEQLGVLRDGGDEGQLRQRYVKEL
ncbi:MAG: hypothetical protein KC731_39905, partial [Myxococcales bacterium]|nr:hypothetical protein [Myxococcales bacterium]